MREIQKVQAGMLSTQVSFGHTNMDEVL